MWGSQGDLNIDENAKRDLPNTAASCVWKAVVPLHSITKKKNGLQGIAVFPE